MVIKKNYAQYEIKVGKTVFSFLRSGDIYEVTHDGIMVNQLRVNQLDGAVGNLYLRLHLPSGIKVVPMLGIQSPSQFFIAGNAAKWCGSVEGGIDYEVELTVTEKGIWFWQVLVNGFGIEVDVIYGQDVGIATRTFLQTNEAYACQYLDHSMFINEIGGYTVCLRQNLEQDGKFPYLEQGGLSKMTGFSTDGFQFFGRSYKETDFPEVLLKEQLANEVLQYEFAYTGLQSEKVQLRGKTQFGFYGYYRDHHPEAVTGLQFAKEIAEAFHQLAKGSDFVAIPKVEKKVYIGEPLKTIAMTSEEIAYYFPKRMQEEYDNSTLLSFFTDTYEHVVLKAKELIVDRPHGHIIVSGDDLTMQEAAITSTAYMYGVFNSQLVVGNTTMNKLMSNVRNSLNVLKASGQRIYVEVDQHYHLLTMPSMFEMGFNYARWYYKTNEELWIITNFTTVDASEITLHVATKSGKEYRYLITNQITMNANEYEVPFHMEQQGKLLTFAPHELSPIASVYPELRYYLHVTEADFCVTDESSIVEQHRPSDTSLVVLDIKKTSAYTVTMQGAIFGNEFKLVEREQKKEIEQYRAFFQKTLNGFLLTQNGIVTDEIAKLNIIAWWYTHNMLVHYLAPHGLEQYGGAAWGTRDVCQGPVEYFMAMGKYDVVREILLTVFQYQFADEGNWPQWFMFDRYVQIRAVESHGDVIVWPLKALADYLRVTGDYNILTVQLPYTKRETLMFTPDTDSLLGHMQKGITYIRHHFLHNTHLSSYGNGDWDDTLQPQQADLKEYMVSSWTVALTYQVIQQLAQLLAVFAADMSADLQQLAKGIESDFHKYIVQAVIPGFLYMEEVERPENMLHPSDTKTGIQYRLLPMTRSMIAELLPPEQAERHYQLIKDHLQCPDGVRLMNRPASYAGGVSTHFKRAEQAAFFGREVALQYVHAHIRFIEAMAKLGKADEAWYGLKVVNPVGITDVVKNAARRQSNCYFSSSDGDFATRYEAQEKFNALRTGDVPVKGGWRIYSSGPGIYMHQLIANCLGIRVEDGDLIIDPVLPKRLLGLQFTFIYDCYPVTFHYLLTACEVTQVTVNNSTVAIVRIANRYRNSGVRIAKKLLLGLLNEQNNEIVIS